MEGEGEQSVEEIENRLSQNAKNIVEDVLELSGLCLLLKKQDYLELDGFDERFGLGNFEDDDLCLKTRLRGGRLLIVHDSYVHHLGNRTFIALETDYEKDLEDKRKIFLEKWGGNTLLNLEKQCIEMSPQEFLPILKQAHLSGPCTQWLRRLQGKTYGELGQTESALKAWQEYLSLYSKDTEARSKEALLLFHLGRSEQARRALMDAFEECWFGPIFAASVLTQVANLVYGESPEEAADYLGYALDICPDFTPGLNLKAVWALEKGQFQEAELILLPFIQKEDSDLWNNLGIAFYQQGRAPEAIQAFTKAAGNAGPDSPAARNLRALCGK
jgi:tetratricopeptide (TPR) repeat protein